GSKSFLISVKMQKKSETSIFMSQKKFTPGMFYMQESNGVEVTNENNVAKLFINNKEVLGLFISAD
ncbi:MAG: hypothetical protein IKI31_03080, partial [Treponema sp.]|nr:hypothetical protein [Treponema sp.]